MQIGEVIRKYRLDKNMTQEEMARRLGVTVTVIRVMFAGRDADNQLTDYTVM